MKLTKQKITKDRYSVNLSTMSKDEICALHDFNNVWNFNNWLA